MSDFVLITCEHGGNAIPARYRDYYAGDGASLLDSHRGYDPGALVMARALAAAFSAPLVYSTVSRLLVDLNRSTGHPRLHAESIRRADARVRRSIIENYYTPYRLEVQQLVGDAIAAGRRVVHVSSHSFTPFLNGKTRRADIGLLYDPARSGEAELGARWKRALGALGPQFTVRRNYPYAGKGDGLTRTLRSLHAPHAYIGIELEINQMHTLGPAADYKRLRDAVIDSLAAAAGSLPAPKRRPRRLPRSGR